MKRRSILKSVAGACAALLFPQTKTAGASMARVLSQWQWRQGAVGSEIEDAFKRVVSRCDIGQGRGTVGPAPRCHNVFHVWVDMDDARLIAEYRNHEAKIRPDFQSRYFVVSVPVCLFFMYTEDDLAESLQRAIDVAKSQPTSRRWKDILIPDDDNNVVDVADYLPNEGDRRPMIGTPPCYSKEDF